MAMEIEERLIAPCGMNCGLCVAYLAGKHDLRRMGIRTTYCAGCRPRGKNCAFMKKRCVRLGEGMVRYCYECPDFPCRRLKTLDKRYRTRYHMSMIENLEYIRDSGVPAFLAKETAKWSCPECDGTVCCHNGVCFDCGLEKLKNKDNRYRWADGGDS
jgi:hypothetical protein